MLLFQERRARFGAYPNGVRALKNVTLTIPAGMYGLLGTQTIAVTVPREPARAGIGPRHLLSKLGGPDRNIRAAKIGR